MAKKTKRRAGFHHLKPEERVNVCGYLNMDFSVSDIARKTHRSKSTISYEIARNSTIKKGKIDDFCTDIKKGRRTVCNGCSKRTVCKFNKKYYDSNAAIKAASKRKHESNARIKASEIEVAMIDEIVWTGVRKGQSPEYICANSDKIKRSPSTIRRWINGGLLTARRIHLCNAKKYKKSYIIKRNQANKTVNAAIKAGRTMHDYELTIASIPTDHVVFQLDSVEGHKTGDKDRILTIFVCNATFQIGRLYPLGKDCHKIVNNHIAEFLNVMIGNVGENTKLILLADNGKEFDGIHELESMFPGRVSVFFTRAYCSTDKAGCERNHEYFRRVIPKGQTFNGLDQDMVDSIFSNVNSYCRPSLPDKKSPCQIFAETYGSEAMEKLRIKNIPASEVDLSPLEY